MIGGGFGGSILVLDKIGNREKLEEEIKNNYREKFNIQASFYGFQISDGVFRITLGNKFMSNQGIDFSNSNYNHHGTELQIKTRLKPEPNQPVDGIILDISGRFKLILDSCLKTNSFQFGRCRKK